MTPVSAPEHSADTDDAVLVHRVADGDRDALRALYDRHAPWLTVRLGRRCGDPDLVDTAVQDTFVGVWRSAGAYRPTGEVGAWIWTIGLRRMIDQMRRRAAPEPVDDIVACGAVVIEEIPIALGDTPVGRAFADLDTELQQVLALTVFDGLTNNEAAVLLSIPAGTVKSRLSRARKLLEEQIS